MKKIVKNLALISAVFGMVGFVGCDKKEEITPEQALKNYIFENNGQVVGADFTLPVSISGLKATWTSSDAAVTLTEREESYLADVIRPSEQKEVTLTLTIGEVQKAYTVLVNPVSVYDFSGSFKFTQKNGTITKSFDLATSHTFEGKECSIVWSVDDASKDIISVSQDGKKMEVVPPSVETQVKCYATFTYGTQTTKVPYKMTAVTPREHIEDVDYWYNNTGVSTEIKGYICGINECSESYENCTIFVVEEDKTAGYYCYRTNFAAADYSKIKLGAYVTITGTTNKNYNGLIETDTGGDLTVDESKQITPEQVWELAYDIGDDIAATAPNAIYHTSAPVTLTNWKVKSIENFSLDSSVQNITVATLEKGDQTCELKITKYLSCFYEAKAGDTACEAIATKVKSLAVGDYINVKGILTVYNGYQIHLTGVDSITAGVQEDVKADVTNVKNGLAAIKSDIDALNKHSVFTGNDEVTLPGNGTNYNVSYQLMSTSPIFNINDGKLVITPQTSLSKVNIKVTVSSGDYSAYRFISVQARMMTAEEKLTAEKNSLSIASNVNSGELSLAKVGSTYSDVAISYEGKTTEDKAVFSYSNGKATIASVGSDTQVTVVATFTLGEDSVTKEITFTVKGVVRPTIATSIDTSKSYRLFLNLNDKIMYATAKNPSGKAYQIAGTVNILEAATYNFESVDGQSGQYYVSTMIDGQKKYLTLIVTDATKAQFNLSFENTKSSIAVFDSNINSLVFKNSGVADVCLGTYTNKGNTAQVFALSKAEYCNKDATAIANVDKTQFPLHLEEITAVSYSSCTTKGTTYSVEGVLIARDSNKTLGYIYNGNSIMVLYDSAALKSLSVGDYVKVTGKADIYKGLLQLKSNGNDTFINKIVSEQKFTLPAANTESVSDFLNSVSDTISSGTCTENGKIIRFENISLKKSSDTQYFIMDGTTEQFKNCFTPDGGLSAENNEFDATNSEQKYDMEVLFYGVSGSGNAKAIILKIAKHVAA